MPAGVPLLAARYKSLEKQEQLFIPDSNRPKTGVVSLGRHQKGALTDLCQLSHLSLVLNVSIAG